MREGNLQPVGARDTPVRGLPSTRIFLLFSHDVFIRQGYLSANITLPT